jgi:DNA topoisomerase-3
MENPRNQDGKRLAGLGTPATRGNILKKLFDRGYLSLKGKNILVSDDGRFLVENILKNPTLANFISVPETTRWEEQLHSDTAAFLAGVKDFVRRAVETTSVDKFVPVREVLGKCPLCGGDIFEGKKNFYCSAYKNDPACRFVIWKEMFGAPVSAADVRSLLSGKPTKPKKCAGKAGKEFQAAFSLANGKIELRFQDKKK